MPKMQFMEQLDLSEYIYYVSPKYLMKIFATAFTIATEIHMRK